MATVLLREGDPRRSDSETPRQVADVLIAVVVAVVTVQVVVALAFLLALCIVNVCTVRVNPNILCIYIALSAL